MRSRNNVLAMSALLVLLLGAFSLPLLAQHHERQGAQHQEQGMIHVGKKGEITLSSPLRVGETMLKPGKYVFQHVVEGDDHVLVFKTATGQEAARLKCRLESLGEKAKETALYTRAGDGGERILDAVRVQGEDVKHVI